MQQAITTMISWARRPQFSLRAFLLAVTFLGAPAAYVGAIKYRAATYRASISELSGRGVDVRQIRTDDAATLWQQFVQNWIETDAYAGTVVEATIQQQDLTDHDVRLLGVFDEIRSLDLASPKLTDATLLQAPKLGVIHSLAIRDGSYTKTGLKVLGSLERLKGLDLSGVVIDSAELAVLEPALGVDDLALVLEPCPAEQLRRAFADRRYGSFSLENAARIAFLKEKPRTLGFDSGSFPEMPITADSLPASGIILLKGMQLSDETLTELSQRKELKQLVLSECHFDATVALRCFRSPAAPATSVSSEGLPLIRLQGEVSAKGELGPEEFAMLLLHPHITTLSVEKLRAPDQALPVLLKMGRVNTLKLPREIPRDDLMTLYKSTARSVVILLPRTEADIAAMVAKNPRLDPIHYRYVDLHRYLAEQEDNVVELSKQREP